MTDEVKLEEAIASALSQYMRHYPPSTRGARCAEAAADIIALIDRRASPEGGWQDISTAPVNMPVLIASGENVGEAMLHQDDDLEEWWWANEYASYHGGPIWPPPRAWQPLPAPPSTLQQGHAGEEG